MSGIEPVPTKDRVIDGEGYPTLPYLLFFNSVYEGDTGATWIPTFQSLTETGTPTISGKYYRISRRICLFFVTIIPGTNTSAVAGTTYIDNFPLTITTDGFCTAVSGNLGGTVGHVVASGNRIYVPAWTTVTVPLTVIGICEVQS